MEKFTLQPGAWTNVTARLLQVVGQNAIRITLGHTEPDENGNPVAVIPDVAAPSFTTQGFDPKVIDLDDWGLGGPAYVYLMPDGDHPVQIVAL